MQINQKIELNNLLQTLFRSGVIEDNILLKENIKESYNSSICVLLQGYGDIRASVHDFEIEEETFYIHDNVLSFHLNYEEHIYMGCSDMDYSNDDLQMEIELKQIDGSYFFSGPNRLEAEEDYI